MSDIVNLEEQLSLLSIDTNVSGLVVLGQSLDKLKLIFEDNKYYIIDDSDLNLDKELVPLLDQEWKDYTIFLFLNAILNNKIPVLFSSGEVLKNGKNIKLHDTVLRVTGKHLNMLVLVSADIEDDFLLLESSNIDLIKEHSITEKFFMNLAWKTILYKKETENYVLNSLFSSILQELVQPEITKLTNINQIRYLTSCKTSTGKIIVGHITVQYSRTPLEILKDFLNQEIEKNIVGTLYVMKSTCEKEYEISFITVPILNDKVASKWAHVTVNPGIHAPFKMMEATELVSNNKQVVLLDKKNVPIEYKLISAEKLDVEIHNLFVISDTPFNKKK